MDYFVEKIDDTHIKYNGFVYYKYRGYYVRGENKKLYPLHRVVYEDYYGKIPRGYVVHHKDEDKSNNHPDNLECMSRSEHSKMHKVGHVLSKESRMKLSKSRTGHRKERSYTNLPVPI